RRDESDDAYGLTRHLDVDAGAHRRHLVAGEPDHFTREALEDVSRTRRFADPFGKRLSFLARKEPAELVLALEDLASCTVEDVRTLLDRARRPRLKRSFRRGNRGLPPCSVRLGVLADHVFQIGGIAVGRGGCAAKPLAADEIPESVCHVLLRRGAAAVRVRSIVAARGSSSASPRRNSMA